MSGPIPRSDYAKIADYYDRVRSYPPETLEFWLTQIIASGRIREGSKVLDIGCGTGRFAIPLSLKTGAKVYGLDNSQEMLARAKEKEGSERIAWIYGDAQQLPFKNESFDCALMAFLLQHLDSDDKERALREAFRVLKTGGRCVIVTTDPERFKREDLLYRSFPKLIEIDRQRFPTIAWLKEHLIAAGFREVFYREVQEPGRQILTDEWLERVKNRFISTLTLLSDEEFAQGLKVFEENLKREKGEKMRWASRYTFIVGVRGRHEVGFSGACGR